MSEMMLDSVIGLAGAFVGFLLREIFNANKKSVKDLSKTLEKTNEILQKNTIACELLAMRLDHVDKKLDEVGELRRDVDKMGASLRSN